MSTICPAILAASKEEYARQVHHVSFARRIQVDLMDGKFAMAKSISLEDVWLPPSIDCDIHFMYQNPMDSLKKLIALRPHMVIIHAEASVHHMHFAAELHKEGVKAGLAILPATQVEDTEDILHSFDHLLIFSGDLGHFGGTADLGLLEKAAAAKKLHPELEVGWDGGVNDSNASHLASAGIDVLNAGGFIQNNTDPKAAYDKLLALAENKDDD